MAKAEKTDWLEAHGSCWDSINVIFVQIDSIHVIDFMIVAF
jgi:hypothetical protein